MKSKQHVFILIFILFFSFFIRVIGIKWDSPLNLHPDEHCILEPSYWMSLKNSKSPESYNRPNQISVYVDNFLFEVSSFLFFKAPLELTFPTYREQFRIIGRFINTLWGTLLVLAIFLIGNLVSKEVGLWAAGIGAIFPSYLINSLYISPDIPLATLSAFSIWTAMKYFNSKNLIYFFITILLTALCTGEKYPGIIFAICFIIQYSILLNPQQPTIKYSQKLIAIIGFIIFISGFLLEKHFVIENNLENEITKKAEDILLKLFFLVKILGVGIFTSLFFKKYLTNIIHSIIGAGVFMIFMFIFFPNLFFNLKEVALALAHETRSIELGQTPLGFFGNILYYLKNTVYQIGISGLAIIIIALFSFLKKRAINWTKSPLHYPLIYIIFISLLSLHWERWAIPFYILPILMIGYGINEIIKSKNYFGYCIILIFTMLITSQAAVTVFEFSSRKACSLVYGYDQLKSLGINRQNTHYEGYSPFSPYSKSSFEFNFKSELNDDILSKKYILISSENHFPWHSENEFNKQLNLIKPVINIIPKNINYKYLPFKMPYSSHILDFYNIFENILTLDFYINTNNKALNGPQLIVIKTQDLISTFKFKN